MTCYASKAFKARTINWLGMEPVCWLKFDGYQKKKPRNRG